MTGIPNHSPMTSLQSKRLLGILAGISLLYLGALILRSLADLLLANQNAKVMNSVSLGDLFSGHLGRELLTYILTIFLLYLLPGIIAWFTALAIARRHHFGNTAMFGLGLGMWGILVLWSVVENTLQYPNSTHAMQTLLQYPDMAIVLRIVLPLITIGIFAVAIIPKLSAIGRQYNMPSLVFFSGIFIIASLPFTAQKDVPHHPSHNPKRPNIILIGIDSLRPDYLNHSFNNQNVTPTILNFLQNSLVFERTYTPLARTFPAWVSILTGLYPLHHGGRTNLISPDNLKSFETLPEKLKGIGYTTAYITDEKRFSNLDESFGFDHVLGPSIGAADFVLGNVNDFPLSNLIVNTRLGSFLFPYNHANRAAWKTYKPETFSILIKRFLSSHREGPLFLATHFCLPHWPYMDASGAQSSFVHNTHADLADRNLIRQYINTVHGAEIQVSKLLTNLKDMGFLENAIVVLLSDHGEGFDYLDQKTIPHEVTRLSGTDRGHGTNVLSEAQYRVVLAMRGYGLQRLPQHHIHTPVSLVDVAPTIVNLLDQPFDSKAYDGVSLLSLANESSLLPQRPIFLETGFTIPAMLDGNLTAETAFEQGFEFYDIRRDNGRLEIKHDQLQKIVADKQRAVILGDWKLAVIVQQDSKFAMLLSNLESNQWITNPEIIRSHAMFPQLFKALKAFYGEELPLIAQKTPALSSISTASK